VLFDWDEEGFQNFVSDPEVPAILSDPSKPPGCGRRGGKFRPTLLAVRNPDGKGGNASPLYGAVLLGQLEPCCVASIYVDRAARGELGVRESSSPVASAFRRRVRAPVGPSLSAAYGPDRLPVCCRLLREGIPAVPIWSGWVRKKALMQRRASRPP
jgi:hypothetical protein